MCWRKDADPLDHNVLHDESVLMVDIKALFQNEIQNNWLKHTGFYSYDGNKMD